MKTKITPYDLLNFTFNNISFLRIILTGFLLWMLRKEVHLKLLDPTFEKDDKLNVEFIVNDFLRDNERELKSLDEDMVMEVTSNDFV